MKRNWWVFALMTALAGVAHGQAVITPVPAADLLARGGTVALKVGDYGAAQDRVRQLALGQGSILLDTRTWVNDKGRRHGLLRFSVPQAGLAPLLPAVQSVGRLYAENVTGTDNESEFEELARRVTRLQQHERRLDGLLQGDRRMRGSDILFLQERLFRASVDESLLTQQRVDLARDAQQSTLVVELFEPGTLPPPTSAVVNLRARFASSLRAARGLWAIQAARAATALAYATVFAPLWAPTLVIALLLLAWLWRRRRALYVGLRASAAWAVGALRAWRDERRGLMDR